MNATDIELVGHNIVSVIESKRLIHHGINKDYMPSGYTVDSFSDDSTIVVEYSAEKGYFDDDTPKATQATYTKIIKDINHAVNHNLPTGPQKIYLISTQEEIPSFRAKFNKSAIGIAHGSKTVFYDHRELAKLIYEQSISGNGYADFYKQFFPTFAQNLDNYEYYGIVPAQCEKHISDKIVLQTIENHYKTGKNLCILHGVSGGGKTQAVIDYIHSKNTDFENILWISGDDWAPDTSLHSIKRSRGGIPINIAGLFNTSKTIFVIDNLDRTISMTELEELTLGFTEGNIVLVTSQLSDVGNEFYLSIPSLSEDVAVQILGENISNLTTEAKEIVDACSFSPLILSTIRNLINTHNVEKNELYAEVLSNPLDITGKDGLSIMSRILEKLNPRVLEALKKIVNTGSYQHDSNFLNHFIGFFNNQTLQKTSILLQTNNPGILKVHDLIANAVQDNLNTEEVSISIEEYIKKSNVSMSPSILREIHICYLQLCEEDERRGNRESDWITYALLQVEGEVKEKISKNIFDNKISKVNSLASLLCLIDAKETHAYTIEFGEKRTTYFENCATEYKNGSELLLTEDIKAELLHHQGKALRRCKKYNEALECFTQLLEFKPNWHATYGQIAHLGTQRGVGRLIKDSGESAMSKLINFIIEDFSVVPLRISLGAIARLRSYYDLKNEILLDIEKVNALANIITISSLEGLNQFYESYVSFTSIFGYKYPEICIELAETLPEMFTMPPEAIDSFQWTSACEAFANTATAAHDLNHMELHKKMIQASVVFANKINEKKKLKAFDARAIAKVFIAADKPQNAIEAISKVLEEDINHWLLYQKSKALLDLDVFPEALTVAEEAFILASDDDRAKDNLAAYYSLKSQCYEKLGEIQNALSEATLALEEDPSDKYKLSLKETIARLKSNL